MNLLALGGRMGSPGDFETESGTRPGFLPGAVPAPHSAQDARDPWLRVGPEGVRTLPLAGQPGYGRMAFLRSQPIRIVDGRIEGGYTSTFELIRPSCSDHPYWITPKSRPWLQWLRGPCTLEAGLAKYDKHLGLLSRPDL
jgi:hypothetical protein